MNNPIFDRGPLKSQSFLAIFKEFQYYVDQSIQKKSTFRIEEVLQTHFLALILSSFLYNSEVIFVKEAYELVKVIKSKLRFLFALQKGHFSSCYYEGQFTKKDRRKAQIRPVILIFKQKMSNSILLNQSQKKYLLLFKL